jgi:hypothetical protein
VLSSLKGCISGARPGDQPGAGGKVRGITGPSSSAQMTVEPSGGAVHTTQLDSIVKSLRERRLPLVSRPPAR